MRTLLLGLASVFAFAGCTTTPASSPTSRKPSAQAPERCYVYAQGGTNISQGPTFPESKVIHSNPLWDISKVSATTADEFDKALKQLQQWQTGGVCMPASEPADANCILHWQMIRQQWSVQIADSYGIRTVVSSSDKNKAHGLASQLKDLGQCKMIAEDAG